MKNNRQNNEFTKKQTPMQQEEFAAEQDFQEMEKTNQFANKQPQKKNFNNPNETTK